MLRWFWICPVKQLLRLIKNIKIYLFNSYDLNMLCFFRVCQNVFLHPFFKEPPRKYLNFTIKENVRGEREKDETFRNAFSRIYLGACQDELFHLELG